MDDFDQDIAVIDQASDELCATFDGARRYYAYRRTATPNAADALLEAAKRYAHGRGFIPAHRSNGWRNARLVLLSIAPDELSIAREALLAWMREDGTGALTVNEVAALKGVDRDTVSRILNSERRVAVFPGALFEGNGRRGDWRIPRDEAEAWMPAKTGPKKR